jgi:hypothetical protein
MGYYSTIYSSPFRSRVSVDKANQILKDLKEKFNREDTDAYYLDIYKFSPVPPVNETDDTIVLDIDCDDCYDKHYADHLLAKVVAEIIHPDEETDIKFIGEDGSHWGYRIKGKDKSIAEIEIEWVENGYVFGKELG